MFKHYAKWHIVT